MNLFRITSVFCLLFVLFSTGIAEEAALRIGGELIGGPKDPATRDAWIEKMKTWRGELRKRINYQDAQYRRPELLWAQLRLRAATSNG